MLKPGPITVFTNAYSFAEYLNILLAYDSPSKTIITKCLPTQLMVVDIYLGSLLRIVLSVYSKVTRNIMLIYK